LRLLASPDVIKVGFIGLGVQGKYLAINLADAGYDLMAFDLRPGPLDEVASHGATKARSNKDVGAHGEIVCICVLDGAQAREVVLGPEGVLSGAKPGSLIVVHSTIKPSIITELHEAAKACNVELIDAPVSGSEPGAKNKTMSYMVGASAETFARCRPLFETSGKNIIHTGGVGTGIRAKLAHQIIICVNMMSAYEGMRVGIEAGLTPEVLEQVTATGAAQSRVADRWFKMKLGPHAQGVFYKDLKLCLEFAHELNVSAPGAALAQQLLEKIVP
jgi:3-hydroxyisobutyrate dehydrogenase-like beta-hydroxyacid dehydrogenase